MKHVKHCFSQPLRSYHSELVAQKKVSTPFFHKPARDCLISQILSKEIMFAVMMLIHFFTTLCLYMGDVVLFLCLEQAVWNSHYQHENEVPYSVYHSRLHREDSDSLRMFFADWIDCIFGAEKQWVRISRSSPGNWRYLIFILCSSTLWWFYTT